MSETLARRTVSTRGASKVLFAALLLLFFFSSLKASRHAKVPASFVQEFQQQPHQKHHTFVSQENPSTLTVSNEEDNDLPDHLDSAEAWTLAEDSNAPGPIRNLAGFGSGI